MNYCPRRGVSVWLLPTVIHPATIILTEFSCVERDAPVFVEIGEAGIAVDHAMRRELAVQCF